MRGVVVALACAATVVACVDKRRDECVGLVAAAKSAHKAVTTSNANTPDASWRDEKRSAEALSTAAGGASDTIRPLAGASTTVALQNVARDYANALKATSDAAHAIPPITDKIWTLTKSINGSQASSIWATALSESDDLQKRCKEASPPHACDYVVPRLAPLPTLATDPDAIAKLAGALEGAPRDDQQFWISVYNLQGALRTTANGLRALTNETIEKRAVESDLAAAKAKLDTALAQEASTESAVEAACPP